MVQEGQATVASLVNTTVSNSWVGQIGISTLDTDKEQGLFLRSVVKVMDYPELKPPLTDLLAQYRKILVIADETLGVADKAVHHIRLKPYTEPVYKPTFRLPYS